jgi:hypothetical protein
MWVGGLVQELILLRQFFFRSIWKLCVVLAASKWSQNVKLWFQFFFFLQENILFSLMDHNCLYRSCISFCRMLNSMTRLPRVSTRLTSQIFYSTSSPWSLIHPTLLVSLTSICELRHKPSLNVNLVKISPSHRWQLFGLQIETMFREMILVLHHVLHSVIQFNCKKVHKLG